MTAPRRRTPLVADRSLAPPPRRRLTERLHHRPVAGAIVAVLAAGVVAALAQPPTDDGGLERAATDLSREPLVMQTTPTSAPSIGSIEVAAQAPSDVTFPTLDPIEVGELASSSTPLGGTYTDLIETYFGSVTFEALIIVQCESQFIPWAVGTNSDGTQDHGLFQINDVHKESFPNVTGVDWEVGRYDPVANTAFARWLYDLRGGWDAWTCRSRLEEPG